MDDLDMILFICLFVAAAIGAVLVVHVLGLAFLKYRDWQIIRKRFGGVKPFWWRVK